MSGGQRDSRMRLALLTMVALLLTMALASLAIGSVHVPIPQIVRILVGLPTDNSLWETIVWDVRLPRTLTAVAAGAALAASGLMMQTMFRNPLAGPYVLGVDQGASLGVAFVTLTVGVGTEGFLGQVGLLGALGRLGAATAGATITLAIVLWIAARVRGHVTLLVVGLLIGYFVSGLVGVMIYVAVPESVQRYMHWTFGSFAATTGSSLGLLALTAAIGIVLAASLSRSMDALLLGEEYADSVGVSVRPARTGLVLGASLLAAAVTATCGPIGFIGVAVPHIARAWLGTSVHRQVLPACCLIGATAAIAADIIARGPGQQPTYPLNAVTALLGAPVLVWLVLRRVEVTS